MSLFSGLYELFGNLTGLASKPTKKTKEMISRHGFSESIEEIDIDSLVSEPSREKVYDERKNHRKGNHLRDKSGKQKGILKRLFNFKVCSRKKQKSNPEESKKIIKTVASIRHQENDLICPICLKFICFTACASCGHCFCDMCINEYFLFSAVDYTLT